MPTLNTRTALTAPAVADLIHVQDVSDTTDGSNGTSKKVTLGDIQTLMNTHSDGGGIKINGYSGNGPWRVFSSEAVPQPADQGLVFGYNCYYDPVSGWAARDVDNVPCIRHCFEPYWTTGGGNYQFEWNLDVAPSGTGVPSFANRLYHMNYYYNTDTVSWWWRTKASPSISGGQWDMRLGETSLEVGPSFTVNVASGAVSIGNPVATATPAANRTVQISVGGNTYYLLASTSAS